MKVPKNTRKFGCFFCDNNVFFKFWKFFKNLKFCRILNEKFFELKKKIVNFRKKIQEKLLKNNEKKLKNWKNWKRFYEKLSEIGRKINKIALNVCSWTWARVRAKIFYKSDQKNVQKSRIIEKNISHNCFRHYKNQPKFVSSLFKAYHLRDCLNSSNYEKTLVEFLALNEGSRLFPYKDVGGHWTIGFGLLLSLNNAKEYQKLAVQAFAKALGRDLPKEIPVEKLSLFSKKNLISKTEAEKLLLYVLAANEAEIRRKFRFYDRLEANIRITLQSLYYNGPALLGANLMRNLAEYVRTSNPDNLLAAIVEIESRLGAKMAGFVGVQNRRYAEGAMCSNRSLDFLCRIEPKLWPIFLEKLKIENPNFCHEIEKLQKFDGMDQNLYEKIGQYFKIFSNPLTKIRIEEIWKTLEKC